MSTQIEKAFQLAAKRNVNINECKECKFFQLEKNKDPVCNFDSTVITDCIVVSKQLNLVP